ncbi:DUF3306 domain-containing protein [Actibacterium pelagium]|uniref:DUF3306 domain-containing protein n=1 Tax=Actibacterium pelagium TaxID=2029103 RepID=A0A917AF70_9RHOB|nr:DUF3306 domain-containing protein [Actibacterium pelagium]GGE48603.1 hypothetical protein GCM10011517_15560 [Actibacterium pelagium]
MSDFWSRRKAAVQAEQEAELREEEARIAEEREVALAEKSDEEILEELGLPDPDTLSEGDNFKVFLTEAVPARIKSRVLRRLWMTNPILANVDGLVDYGEDFTDASMVVENMQTTYQVGKGMTRHLEEMARQAEAEQQEEVEEASEEPETLEDVPEEDLEEVSPEVPDLVAEEAAPAPVVLAFDDDAEIPEAPRRRMRFAFDEQGEDE